MSNADHRRRLDRVEDVLDGGDEDLLLVMVMCEDDLDLADPRLAPLVAQARTEGRMTVTPWEETAGGELVDTSAPSHGPGHPDPA